MGIPDSVSPSHLVQGVQVVTRYPDRTALGNDLARQQVCKSQSRSFIVRLDRNARTLRYRQIYIFQYRLPVFIADRHVTDFYVTFQAFDCRRRAFKQVFIHQCFRCKAFSDDFPSQRHVLSLVVKRQQLFPR